LASLHQQGKTKQGPTRIPAPNSSRWSKSARNFR
jgi:hypothetical protein